MMIGCFVSRGGVFWLIDSTVKCFVLVKHRLAPKRNGHLCYNTREISVYQKIAKRRANAKKAIVRFPMFNDIPERTVGSWNAILAGHVKNGRIEQAWNVFDKMTERDVVSWTTMIGGYSKAGKIEDARQLFDKMPERNVVSWNAMITGYVQNGMVEDARRLFEEAPERDVVTWTAMVKGYAQKGRIRDANNFFDRMPEKNVVSWTVMVTALIYCGRLDEARKLFDEMPDRNVVSWTAMITGYVQNGRVNDARELFDKMPERDVVTWNAMITGYAQNGNVKEAQRLFDKMPHRNAVSWNAMICGYSQRGEVEVARQLFDEQPRRNVVSWNSMIACLTQNGKIDEARVLFERMPERNGISWNSMVAGYAQNGRIEDARDLFDKMPERDVISFNAMIAGYAQNEHGEQSLKLYSRMKKLGMKPNQSTLTSVLSACASLAVLEQGKQVHEDTIKTGLESNVFVASALIAMYSKCGSIDHACRVFDVIPTRDVVSWNSMISGYALHGYGKEALKVFDQMQLAKVKPNAATFVGVLSACSHAGLVDKGLQYFDSMRQEHSITPTEDHYGCIIGLLGRAGCLDEAEEIINNMPFEPPLSVLGALLGACRIHKKTELGKHVAECIFKLEPKTAAPYIALSNIYADAGRWNEVMNVRKYMKDKGVKKNPGCSWVEVKNRVYTFLTGDQSHPETEKIYAALEGLVERMKEAGYVPDTNFVLHDVEEEEKDQILNYHSEKLAIVFGLISTPSGMPIKIFKNLRVCGDCHNATKFISKVVDREIVVRDANRFHHFQDGFCSCGDFW